MMKSIVLKILLLLLYSLIGFILAWGSNELSSSFFNKFSLFLVKTKLFILIPPIPIY